MGAFKTIAKRLFDDFFSAYSSADKGLEKIDVDPNLEKEYGSKLPPKLTDLNSFRNTEVFKKISKNMESEVSEKLGPTSTLLAPDKKLIDDAAAQAIDTDVYGSFASSDIWEDVGEGEISDIVSELSETYKLDSSDVETYLGLFGNANERVFKLIGQRSRLPEGFTPLLDLPNVKQSTDDFLRDEMFDLDDIDDIDDLLDQVSLQDRFEAVQSMGGGADMIRQELKETYSLTDDFISDLLSKEGFQ
jgi:hypothetical protein